ncbi:MAG: hypothetical protein AABW93_00355 [Nanoarchaeota archaeon]
MDNKKVNNALFPRNHRGQELSTNAIIMIIIGLVVLVVLILGFTLGWDRIFPFFFSSNNVETLKTNCGAACATGNVYNYCQLERTLKAEDLPKEGVKGSCNDFSGSAYEKYGIGACPTISCPSS